MHYVYLLENKESRDWYIGYSSNLRQRVQDHNSGKGAKYTKKRFWKLIYYEAYLNKQDAIGREKFLKSGAGRGFVKKQLQNYLTA